MRIGINVPALLLPKAGVGNYTYSLVNALSRIDRENEYVVFVNSQTAPYIEVEGENFALRDVSHHTMSQIRRVFWEQLSLPRLAKSLGIDLIHSMNMLVPLRLGCRSVVTVHDLTMLDMGFMHMGSRRLFYSFMVPRSLRRADAVIAVSENTRRDILRRFPLPEQKVKVVYEGVRKGCRPPENESDIQATVDQLGVRRPYILYAGTLEPRKNLVRLVEAYSLAKSRLPQDPQLVLAGKKGWGYDEIFRRIRELRLETSVVCTGFVSDTQLWHLYSGASVFAYVSLYEGFGLPPLEAMACGVPVVASGTSSIPEVVGDAAELVDPQDTEGIARALQRVYNDPEYRRELGQRGRERASRFTWEKAAQGTLQVYRSCMGGIR